MADEENQVNFEEHPDSPPMDDEMEFLDAMAEGLLPDIDHRDTTRGLRSNRRFRALSDPYKKDAEVVMEAFGKGLGSRQRNGEMSQTMKQ